MPFVNARCTNCGGDLQVDNTKDAWICNHCGSPFIVEKAINNYNTVNYNQIQANVVNVYGGNSADFVIRGGVLEKYNGASTHVEIPNTVTHIGQAFKSCSGLVSVKIPDSVKVIGDEAFCGCISLTSVTLSNSVTRIGYGAFSRCSSLSSITIPDSVTEIGMVHSFDIGAFSGCTSLTSITIPNNVKAIGMRAFEGCTNLASITIPDSVTIIGSEAFNLCPKLHNINYSHLHQHIGAFPAYQGLLRNSRISQGKCSFCGGSFKLFSSTCKNCNRKKDY